jgi:hypothetical protein
MGAIWLQYNHEAKRLTEELNRRREPVEDRLDRIERFSDRDRRETIGFQNQ